VRSKLDHCYAHDMLGYAVAQVSRRWRSRKHVQNVALYVFDELHLVGGANGSTLEVVVSRARYVAQQLEKVCDVAALNRSAHYIFVHRS
jgi:hypothetical protein